MSDASDRTHILVVLEEVGIRLVKAREGDEIVREIHVARARADRRDDPARDRVIAEMIIDDPHHPRLHRRRGRHERDGELRLGVRRAGEEVHVARESGGEGGRREVKTTADRLRGVADITQLEVSVAFVSHLGPPTESRRSSSGARRKR